MSKSKKLTYFVTIIMLTSVMRVMACTEDYPEKARYDNYRLIRVHLGTQEHVDLFQELEDESDSYTFYGHALNVNQDVTIMVAAHKIFEIQDLTQRFGIKYTILQRNIQKLIDDEEQTVMPKETPATEFNWTQYFQLDTIFKWMDKQIAENDFVTGFDLGTTYEGELIRGLKISKNLGKTGIFVESGIHAREWISPAVATYLIDKLIRSDDKELKYLVSEFDWFFVVVLNADGYKYTFEKDRLWRKNTKPYGRCRGVDLNRNFDINWNGTGSSSDKSRYDFCGSAPFSEPETRAVKLYMDEFASINRIQTYLSLHSFSQLFMFPYGHVSTRVRNYDDLKSIGEKAVEAIKEKHGKIYVSGSSIETIYPNSGSSMDYIYTNYNIPVVYTIELRGPKETPTLFLLPANEIKPTCEEIMNSLIALLKEAKSLGYYADRDI